MSPGDLSKLAASLATAEGVKPAHVAVVLSLAAQSGPDGGAVISAAKLAQRCGMSRGHAFRSIGWAIDAGLLNIETVEGRSNRYIFPVTRRAGATGEARGRAGGGAQARHVSSIPSSTLPAARSSEPHRGLRIDADDGPRMSMREWLDQEGKTLDEARGSKWG